MNAVLQSLLGIKCFVSDITRADHVSKDSLCYMLQLLSSKHKGADYVSSSHVLLLSKIHHIVCKRGKTLSGFNEQVKSVVYLYDNYNIYILYRMLMSC